MEVRDKRVLYKMRIEAQLITSFIVGLNYDEFVHNEVMKRAITMTLANIGVLCSVLSDNIKIKYNDIPWAAIRKTRNVISHDYEAVDFKVIWKTVNVDIPILIEKINAIECDIGLELYGEVEREANYDEIMKAIKDADDTDDNGE